MPRTVYTPTKILALALLQDPRSWTFRDPQNHEHPFAPEIHILHHILSEPNIGNDNETTEAALFALWTDCQAIYPTEQDLDQIISVLTNGAAPGTRAMIKALDSFTTGLQSLFADTGSGLYFAPNLDQPIVVKVAAHVTHLNPFKSTKLDHLYLDHWVPSHHTYFPLLTDSENYARQAQWTVIYRPQDFEQRSEPNRAWDSKCVRDYLKQEKDTYNLTVEHPNDHTWHGPMYGPVLVVSHCWFEGETDRWLFPILYPETIVQFINDTQIAKPIHYRI
ncbi:hypothetical protein MPER_13210 [Moniliophthora perniciosa FA553]|nr:hypothetical protein MPER_13210 [Moniliophthora perniciosa FA553]